MIHLVGSITAFITYVKKVVDYNCCNVFSKRRPRGERTKGATAVGNKPSGGDGARKKQLVLLLRSREIGNSQLDDTRQNVVGTAVSCSGTTFPTGAHISYFRIQTIPPWLVLDGF